jgi:hemerythrin-like metal-binding protein
MPHLEWSESLSVHVEDLDRQHRRFIDMCNDMHDALMAGEPGRIKGTRDETLGNLKAYLQEHFEDEEAYMEKIGYSGIEAHKKEHRDFAVKVDGYITALAGGELVLSSEIMKSMLNWFFDHVAGEDARYRDFAESN